MTKARNKLNSLEQMPNLKQLKLSKAHTEYLH